MPKIAAAQKQRWDFRSPRFRYHKNLVGVLLILLLILLAPQLH
jgi:hypothetical protein